MIRHTPWDMPPHDFTIGLRPIDEASWLEGGEVDAARKAALLGDDAPVWAEEMGSRAGQAEVLSLVERATGQVADSALPPLWARPMPSSCRPAPRRRYRSRGPQGRTACSSWGTRAFPRRERIGSLTPWPSRANGAWRWS